MGERLSTSLVGADEAFSFWADLICEVYVGLDCNAPSSQGFSGGIERTGLGEVVASKVEADGQRVRRSPRRIRAQPSSDVLLSLHLSGPATIVQDDRAAVLKPGDLTLYDATRPYDIILDDHFSMLVFQMPRTLLESRVGHLRRWTARRIDGSRGAGRLASRYLRAVHEEATALDVRPEAVIAPGLDLVASALSRVPPSTEEESGRGALLIAAKDLIETRLTEDHVTRQQLAAQLNVSVRQLTRLFAEEGTSPGAYLRERRLQAARRCLMHRGDLGISEVAHRYAFSDASHFSRCFRERFGMSPRDYRSSHASA